MTEPTDEDVKAAARAIAAAGGCHGYASHAECCDPIGDDNCDCAKIARAALSAVLPGIVERERNRAANEDEQRVADAYQIVGRLADTFGVHDHPEVVRALDWLAYGKTEDGSDILPWPRAPLIRKGDSHG